MANIRDEDLSRYLAVFHDIYRSTVESLIPRELQANLFRSQFLDTGVYGYISTQLGAGYEYVPGRSRGLSVNHGGARIEDLILDTPKFVRRLRATGIAMGNGVFTLERVGFSDIYPFRLHGEAFVRLVDVDMRAGRWHRHIAYAEIATDRSTEYWSETAAVVRAKDELLLASLTYVNLSADSYRLLTSQLISRRSSRNTYCCVVTSKRGGSVWT